MKPIDGNRYYSENAIYLEWVNGFISSVNIIHPDRQVRNDNYATELWIRNWCNAHPTERFADAVTKFVHAHAITK